jgi:hypothetical protein
MDPYIEAQGLWPGFHLKLISYLQEAISERLPAAYEAVIEQRIRLVEEGIPTKDMRPDVAIVRDENGPAAGASRASGGTMLLEPVTLTLPTLWVEEREAWIEIRQGTDRSLVTVIEILSPSNKSGTGQGVYAAKRRELIRQDVHIVELDLLLAGERLPVVEPLPAGDYYAYVARADRRPQCSVYAWSIRRPLPLIPIPLRAPDPDITIDLGAVFRDAYDRGYFRRAIRYDRPPELPLSAGDRAWAEAVARGEVL